MTWYHGTTADHAQDIIHHGINWNKGLPMMDFSNGKGFYLQDSLQSAMEWSQLMARAEKQFRIQQAERRVQRLQTDVGLTSDEVAKERLSTAQSRLDKLKQVLQRVFAQIKLICNGYICFKELAGSY